MKIAMVTTWDEPCGIADYAQALVAALRSTVEVKVVVVKHGQRSAAYFREIGRQCNDCDLTHIQHEYIFFGGRDPWNNYWKAMLSTLKTPYIITSHTWLRNFQGGSFLKRIVRGLRDTLYRWMGWSRFLEMGQFEKAEKVLVHTQAYARALCKRGIPLEKIEVVPQGVPDWSPGGDEDRARKRWNVSGLVVTLFGFLIPSKGHLLALDAWAKLSSSATLMIVGKPFSTADQAYADAIRNKAKIFKERVKLTGYLEQAELMDLLAASSVVLMPYLSGTSSYSLSLLMAQSRAVLASDIECFQEIADQTTCLELFKTGDALDLKNHLDGLLNDMERRRHLRHAAHTWAQIHSWDTIASRLVKVYTETLE
jgi:glycosyltransferase involved in cell wall biosynthesis